MIINEILSLRKVKMSVILKHLSFKDVNVKDKVNIVIKREMVLAKPEKKEYGKVEMKVTSKTVQHAIVHAKEMKKERIR